MGVEPPRTYKSTAPRIAETEVAQCPVCAADKARPFAEGFDYEMETCANHWRFQQCVACETVWLNPRPHESTLPIIYPPAYYAYDMSDQLHPFILAGKAMIDRMKFSGILRALDRQPMSYLDVGCGDGRYLKQFTSRGVAKERVFGVDLPSPSIERLRGEGFQVHAGRIEDCQTIAPGSLDLITIFHVLEHVADPIAVLAKLTQWLAPGGVLAIETPNINSWDARAFRATYWGGYHIPRHWTLFNEQSLAAAVKKVGLEKVGLRYQTGHSFWLYSFHHMLKYGRKPRPKTARLFDPMHSRVFLMAFTGLDIFRRTIGQPTSAALMLARKPAR